MLAFVFKLTHYSLVESLATKILAEDRQDAMV
jgi:hypothetical protein